MTSFKKFATDAVKLPATVLTAAAKQLLGANRKYSDGTIVLESPKKSRAPVVTKGLLGLLLDGIATVGRGATDFISAHKTAIATAFWASAALAGTVALALYLAPSALAAVAAYSVYGYSIVGIVGTNPLLQIGFAATLAFTATSAVTYMTATVANTVAAIRNTFTTTAKPGTSTPPTGDGTPTENSPSVSPSLKKIHTPTSQSTDTSPSSTERNDQDSESIPVTNNEVVESSDDEAEEELTNSPTRAF